MRTMFSSFLFLAALLPSLFLIPSATRALPTDDWILICSLVYRPAASPTPAGKFEVIVRERRVMECVSKQVPGTGDPVPPKTEDREGPGPRGGGGSDRNDPVGLSCEDLKSRISSLEVTIARDRANMDAATESLDIINRTLATLAGTQASLLSAVNRARVRCEAAQADLEAFVNVAAFKACKGKQGEKKVECYEAVLEQDAAKGVVSAHETECGAYSKAGSQYSDWQSTKATADRTALQLTRDIGKLRVGLSNLRQTQTAFVTEYKSRCEAYP